MYSKRLLPPHVAAQDFIYNENGSYMLSLFSLKEVNKWYYEIRGEMAVTKLKIADLIIYTN